MSSSLHQQSNISKENTSASFEVIREKNIPIGTELRPASTFQKLNLCVPHRNADAVFSVSCGNSRLHWAMHTSVTTVDPSDKSSSCREFVPTLFWKSVPGRMKPASVNMNSESLLKAHLAPPALATIFGSQEDETAATTLTSNYSTGEDASKKIDAVAASSPSSFYTTGNGITYRSMKRIPTIYVYVVSTNPVYARVAASLFEGLPSIVFTLSASDFAAALNTSPTSNASKISCYDGIGIDRVANIAGAKYLYKNSPSVLVIDGGTATTYTTTTESGKLGGGIGTGLRLKFKALQDYGAYPYVDYDSIVRTVERCSRTKTPLSEFVTGNTDSSDADQHSNSSDNTLAATRKAILANILRETALLLCNIIQNWLGKIPTPTMTTAGSKDWALPTIVLTGGDSLIFHKLLQPNHSYIVETDCANRELLKLGHHTVGDEGANVTTAATTADSKQQASLSKNDVDNTKSGNRNINPSAMFQIAFSPKLPHFGIQSALSRAGSGTKTTLSSSGGDGLMTSTIFILYNQLLGCRVAIRRKQSGGSKNTSESASEATTIMYGTIMAVNDAKCDQFTIFYDSSGLVNDMKIVDVYSGLKLYAKTTAKNKIPNEFTRTKVLNKVKDVTDALKYMKEEVPQVVDYLAKKKQQKKKAKNSKKRVAPPSKDGTAVEPVKKQAKTAPKGSVGSTAVAKSSEPQNVAANEDPEVSIAAAAAQDLFDPTKYLNRRVAKVFQVNGDSKLYFGTVRSHSKVEDVEDEGIDERGLWHIVYDDEDEEDFDHSELVPVIKLYKRVFKKDPRVSMVSDTDKGNIDGDQM